MSRTEQVGVSTVRPLTRALSSPAHSSLVGAAVVQLTPAVPAGAEAHTGIPVASMWVFRKSLKGPLFSPMCA